MSLVQEYRHFIDGQWTASRERVPNINPSNTDDVIGEAPCGTAEDVHDAVAAARKAFAAWSSTTPEYRSDILDRAGSTILARVDELGDLLAREEGKTLPEAKAEMARAARLLKYFAGEALRLSGDLLASTRPGVSVEITREAVGVIGVITPWNFPIAIPAWKIAPALAFGNCVVFKPAELTPGCAHILVEALAAAGVPDGVLNLVYGTGAAVGDAIAGHAGIDAVSFTGSVRTGELVRARAMAHGAKVQLEMGGKNPLVVLDDGDLDTAIRCAINGAFYSTGQRCTASSRLIVTRGIHDSFVARMQEAVERLSVGDARSPNTEIGPVVSEPRLSAIEEYLSEARRSGLDVLGGDRLEAETPGFFLRPALALRTPPGARINREEIFGPVASIVEAADFDEAVSLANDTAFGLCAGIITSSLRHATEYKKLARSGMVMVNLPTAGVDYHVPFGGVKASSYGPREQGVYAREFYTVVKTSYIASS